MPSRNEKRGEQRDAAELPSAVSHMASQPRQPADHCRSFCRRADQCVELNRTLCRALIWWQPGLVDRTLHLVIESQNASDIESGPLS
jgi:hypothetical protein